MGSLLTLLTCDMSANNVTLLFDATYRCDVHDLCWAIEGGKGGNDEVNAVNEMGYTALHYLVCQREQDWRGLSSVRDEPDLSGRLACISALLDAGADVNRMGGPGDDSDEEDGDEPCTPLLEALFSFRGRPTECEAVTTMLLRAGADVRLGTPDGMTPLHLAAMWGLGYIIPTLLAAGAEVDAIYNIIPMRETPLESAIRFVNHHGGDRKRVFAKLLRAGARLPTNVHNCPPYLISVWANGGFARYERIHRTRRGGRETELLRRHGRASP